jgi:hypothetical protein
MPVRRLVISLLRVVVAPNNCEVNKSNQFDTTVVLSTTISVIRDLLPTRIDGLWKRDPHHRTSKV